MSKAFRNFVKEILDSADPHVTEADLKRLAEIRTKTLISNLFTHLTLGNIEYRDGTVVSLIESNRTPEAKEACARAVKTIQWLHQTSGFYLPITFENSLATIEALQAGEFTPRVSEYERWGLWRVEESRQYDYDPQWRSVQAGRVAILAACGWFNLPLPTDAGECLAVLEKWPAITGPGEMESPWSW